MDVKRHFNKFPIRGKIRVDDFFIVIDCKNDYTHNRYCSGNARDKLRVLINLSACFERGYLL